MSYIQFNNITKNFAQNRVLTDVNLTIEEGQLVTLLGPSGCGKSTLLRILSGLETPTSGRVILDNEDITDKSPRFRNIGMVFQQYSLFPNMTVTDNIAFGLKTQKKFSSSEINKRVGEAIEMVELRGKEKAYPAQLSGGQQQRVALARSIVTRPKVLLLDEPLSAIDAKLRRSLQTRIREIQKSLGITAVFVTHDQDEAMIMSDVIHLLSAGKIEQSGSPIEMYTAPKTRFAASFIGHYNILAPAAFAALTGQSTSISGDIAIRPEAVEISTVPQEFSDCAYHLRATVDSYIPHGNVLRYTVTSSGVSLEADALFRSFTIFEPGQTVYLCILKRNCLPV